MLKTTLKCVLPMLAALALGFGLVGCAGPEKQTITENPTPTAVPGGGSQDDYEKKMRENIQSQGAGGGGGVGGAPTAPPAGAPR